MPATELRKYFVTHESARLNRAYFTWCSLAQRCLC